MGILKMIEDMFERRRFLTGLLLFLVGAVIGHVLCRIAYLIYFLVAA